MKRILLLIPGILIIIVLLGMYFFHHTKPQQKLAIAATDPLAIIPKGQYLNQQEIQQAYTLFHDQYLTGGQEKQSPRIVRWVNPNTFIFLEFDNPQQARAKKLQFMGIGVKGVYCKETQPDQSFSHFLKYDAPVYDQSEKLQPGDQGYWMSFAAVDTFPYDGRKDTPGIDYQYDKLTPPSCGPNIPTVSFTPADAKDLTQGEIMTLASYFNDNKTIFYGGQKAPRVSKWVNPNAFIFLQFDNQTDPTQATAVRYLGLGVRGMFCQETQPSKDFPHLHMPVAKLYAFGHASHAKDTGYWLMGVAVTNFNNNGRDVSPEIDRKYNLEEIPSCNSTTEAMPSMDMNMSSASGTPSQSLSGTPTQAQVITVTATEFSFSPNEIHLPAGQAVTIKFKNAGTMEHTFTIPGLHVDTAGILPGHEKDVTFTTPSTPGTYNALCTMGGHLQLGMKATVNVE